MRKRKAGLGLRGSDKQQNKLRDERGGTYTRAEGLELVDGVVKGQAFSGWQGVTCAAGLLEVPAVHTRARYHAWYGRMGGLALPHKNGIVC